MEDAAPVWGCGPGGLSGDDSSMAAAMKMRDGYGGFSQAWLGVFRGFPSDMDVRVRSH